MFKGRHFDKSVILLCVRGYLVYNLSLRNVKEMMAERGIDLDHSTVHRWVICFSPKLPECFNRKKRQVTRKWNLDETYIKVKGEWLYLYRAIDSNGDTVEFYFSKHRDLTAAKRFIRKALARHGRPARIAIDGSETNRIAIVQCDAESRLSQTGKPIAIRCSEYMNNTIERDHRRIKRRTRSMLGFKSETAAGITLAGIELIHMMRKQQCIFEYQKALSIKQQFEVLAA
ncbi:IS6 family transposase [Brucella pseudogrignonensis]|uniref:IS6 family transposase n=1 Tax=Brucella pseudogrignonensis TaxID=419475 RepID=A0A7Y3WZ98_9HYPH|nr:MULTISPECIES: IS6 family transposase [Brucella]MCM0753388.1 IS6 family transposase [Brucella pseudogrignonensis]NNV23111.1 IS6 family transposase [Brucella pseudogrignonensis]